MLIQNYRSIEIDLSGLDKYEEVRVIQNLKCSAMSPIELIDELIEDFLSSQKASFAACMAYLAYLTDIAKQKFNELLLLILTITVLKNHLEQLIQFISSLSNAPLKLIFKPTRSARITPFIYFP